MRITKIVIITLTISFSHILLTSCTEEKQGIKLSKEPYKWENCDIYFSTAKEAQKNNDQKIVDALRNYNDMCFTHVGAPPVEKVIEPKIPTFGQK